MNPKAALAGRMLQVAGHVLTERITRPQARTATDVPGGPEAFTEEWLTDVLCRDAPGAAVTGFSTGDRSDGSTSRGRLTVTYNDVGRAAGLPESLWFKSSPSIVSRLVTGLTGAASAEGRFYMRARPQVEMLAPRGYHGAAHVASCRSVVLIEDIERTRGARFAGPADRYVTRSMAESMARELAAYHAVFWESPRFAADLAWVPTSLAFQEQANAVINFEGRTLVGVDRIRDLAAPGFADRRNDIYPAAMESLRMNLLGPQTLLHQDLHAGNWYSTGAGEMGLYDWHCIARGGWALDVVYAFMSGLTVEDRQAWERELLEHYLDLLRAGGVASPPAFETAWLQYRQQTWHGLIFWLYTIGAGRLQPDMQPVEISRTNLERMTAAVMQLDSFGAMNETAVVADRV